ncbi:alpha/beta hydrolase [Streptomyces sp. A244]|uniref:alpha/beta hydrolase n=1 Tax=Streptomyces sp. A244 TaxID=2137016 RepID=UPI002159AAD9|nr:alpha/beta hydrolase [Streptomyces sp. A244]
MGRTVDADGAHLWVEQRGVGPDVLLVAGLAFAGHDTLDRLGGIGAPTLVLAGELDLATPPRLGRAVADGIPGAVFEMLPGEAHQPFQEVPEVFNARVGAFWREEARDEGAAARHR